MQVKGHHRSILTMAEAAIVSVLCFGVFIATSTQAVLAGFPAARFSDAGNEWSIVVEAILALAALLYLRMRNFDTASLYPRPTLRESLMGLVAFALSWLIGLAVTAPLATAEQPLLVDFSYSASSLPLIVLFAMVNGAFEEVFLLGVLVRGLRGYGLSIAIGVPLLVRVSYHLYQGPVGVVWVLVIGLTFTLIYLRLGRLWPLVLAHILWDIVPIYLSS